MRAAAVNHCVHVATDSRDEDGGDGGKRPNGVLSISLANTGIVFLYRY